MILANNSEGMYIFRNELVQELLKYHQVILSIPDEDKASLFEEEGCTVERTPMNRRGTNPFQDLKLMHAYRKLVRKYRPDLVLCYTIKPDIYGGIVCASENIPYICTVTGLGTAFQKKGLFLKMIELLYSAALRKVSCVFFQNEENRRIFQAAGLISDNSRLVSGSGVNLKTHPVEPYPEDPVTLFLYVGRIMKEKGIDEFLAAAELLAGENIQFAVMGYCDEDYEGILSEKQKEGYISYLGFRQDVQNYYRKAAAVVLPTYHEGMSNVLMEAAAAGRPVIASNISGCREIFEEGVTGFGFAPRSKEALITALKDFLALPRADRAAMGRSARAKIEREFDRNLVTQAYMEEIGRVLDRKRKSESEILLTEKRKDQ